MLNIVLADTPEIYGRFRQLYLTVLTLHSDVLNGNATVEVIPPIYEFMDPHLVDFSVRVKNLHLVDSSEGKTCSSRSEAVLTLIIL